MNKFIKSCFMGGTLFISLAGMNAFDGDRQNYPQTKVGGVVEILHGLEVADPYRWLEDDIRENKDVQNWVYDQNIVTHAYLETLDDRAPIAARMTELWNYEKFSTPQKRGNLYFFTHNSGLQNQNILYVQEGLKGTPKALIDPNDWAVDGTTSMAGYAPSPDGSKILYAVQDGGSDWRTLHVLDVAEARVLEDNINWAKFSSLTWNKQGTGFFYARFPAPEEGQELQSLNANHSIYYHKVGTEQDEDRLMFMREDHPTENVSAAKSDDGKYLIISTSDSSKGAGNTLHLVNTEDEGMGSKPLNEGFDITVNVIGSVGETFYAITNDGSPLNKIVAIELDNPGRDNWRTIVPEKKHVIRGANLVGGKLTISYLEDVKSAIHLFAIDGTKVGSVDLPGMGTANGFDGNGKDTETFYSFASYNMPNTIFRYDFEAMESSVFIKPETSFDPKDIEVSQVFYRSKDGTQIPMYIMHKKDVDISEPTATILYGYGGFNISILPSFNAVTATWLEMGGVYAVATLRGGGEYGKAWHDAGKRGNKQNVFDDFIAAAEYLIAENITNSDKLTIYGHSNGGLLVGATVNQRPDLFAAGLAGAGVMDMLRFSKFTAGRYWVDDYGKVENEEDFENLLKISPYHNIKDGVEYPPVFVTAADRDDRVVPGHSFKYAARLQAADIGDAPHLIRVETRAGHGSGMPTEKRIAVYVDYWAFAAKHSGLKLPKDFKTKEMIN
ncbi:MAG: prolyl oligopeptidase family serine peptidase [Sphingomonadales bacterium]